MKLRNSRPEVIHYTKADIPRTRIAPTVVTIYDIIPLLLPETQSALRRLYWPNALERAATQSDRIITISEGSKKDIIRRFNVPPEKIVVTRLPVDTAHFYPRKERLYQKPYLLFVGTRDQRKNISALLRAFARICKDIPHDLLIIGRAAHKADSSRQDAKELGIESRVQFLEDVTHEQLPVYYSGADIFIWPSAYEGWSFPAMEAMACGTPVIVSNGNPLPEVVGDAGLVVPFTAEDVHDRLYDNDFSARLADEITALLADPARRSQMAQRGKEHAQKTSWHEVALATEAVYKELV